MHPTGRAIIIQYPVKRELAAHVSLFSGGGVVLFFLDGNHGRFSRLGKKGSVKYQAQPGSFLSLVFSVKAELVQGINGRRKGSLQYGKMALNSLGRQTILF